MLLGGYAGLSGRRHTRTRYGEGAREMQSGGHLRGRTPSAVSGRLKVGRNDVRDVEYGRIIMAGKYELKGGGVRPVGREAGLFCTDTRKQA